jgi:hypothetical protein
MGPICTTEQLCPTCPIHSVYYRVLGNLHNNIYHVSFLKLLVRAGICVNRVSDSKASTTGIKGAVEAFAMRGGREDQNR